MTRAAPYLPFFVYGTLLPGQPNYDVWATAVIAMRPAEIGDCRLFDLGHYPMLVPSPGGRVSGLVVDLDPEGYAGLVAALDYLEGVDMASTGEPAYRRVRRVARLADGHAVAVWLYIGHPAWVVGLPPVEGSWKTHVRRQQQSAVRRAIAAPTPFRR